MTKTYYIRDDLGDAWAFDGTRIYNVLAEMEMENHNENGYPCDSWEEGIEILNKGGYITGFVEFSPHAVNYVNAPEPLPAPVTRFVDGEPTDEEIQDWKDDGRADEYADHKREQKYGKQL